MDLRIYYEKIREIERTIVEEFPIMVSHATPDGGKAGTLTEVTRRLAAKLILDGLARLATSEEAVAFRQKMDEARRAAEDLARAARVQLTLLPHEALAKLKSLADAKE